MQARVAGWQMPPVVREAVLGGAQAMVEGAQAENGGPPPVVVGAPPATGVVRALKGKG